MKKKLLVTGSTGMVGTNLLKSTMATEWDILAPTRAILDLTNWGSVEIFFKEHKPDLVIHAAGKVGGIVANINSPVDFLDVNTIISRNVIMAARNVKVKYLINLGSTCIYPRFGKNPLNEDSILSGELEPTNEGYAISKILALKLCQFIRKENPYFQYKTLVPCNLYGPHDKFEPHISHMIPAIIRKINLAKVESRNSVEIWGDGNARREFMYVGDLIDAIFKCANNMECVPDIMNIGLGYDHSVKEYYTMVAKVLEWGGGFEHDMSKPVGMAQKLADVSRQKEWGWAPVTSLHDGVKSTLDFYKDLVE
jgi:GDP-L-fucose synthase